MTKCGHVTTAETARFNMWVLIPFTDTVTTLPYITLLFSESVFTTQCDLQSIFTLIRPVFVSWSAPIVR